MIVSADKGHIGGSLSCVEILVTLYYGGTLRFNLDDPNWDGRDRFILSKGHAAPALYCILADLGFFPISELASFCQKDSRLEGHPHRGIPGIEVNTGSLGHGLGIGAGLALRAKLDKLDYMTVILLSDGECYEGSVWEAAMFASHHKLDNLIAIIDRNQQSSIDFTENYLQLEPLSQKWHSFGWRWAEVDGHSFEELLSYLSHPNSRQFTAPLVIIANTIKGKGISFMEGKIEWHNRVPAGKDLEKARQELEIDYQG